MKEFEYIAWLRSQIPSDRRVMVGPGDDAAVLAPTARPLVVTTDVLTEGVDFLQEEASPRQIGRKAMNVNLSDIAAMAALPMAAVVGLVLPRRGGARLAEELFLGLRDAAESLDVAIVGGDTNSWDGPLVISVTVLGEVSERGPVTRRGAKPGDWLFATGSFGGSRLGRHLNFTPRVREALALHAQVPLHALIDVSDGLAADLHHILEESGCGAVIIAEDIPLSTDALAISQQSGRTPLEHALSDGEDFELIFVVSPEDGRRLLDHPPNIGVAIHRIGECLDTGFWLQEKGQRRPLQPSGWVHRFE